jgi:hypothetical protein
MSLRKNAVAWVALFVALGGSSYAAIPSSTHPAVRLKTTIVSARQPRTTGPTPHKGTNFTATAECPAGTKVVGGGYRLDYRHVSNLAKYQVADNAPVKKPAQGWRVTTIDLQSGIGTFVAPIAYAVCASVS